MTVPETGSVRQFTNIFIRRKTEADFIWYQRQVKPIVWLNTIELMNLTAKKVLHNNILVIHLLPHKYTLTNQTQTHTHTHTQV